MNRVLKARSGIAEIEIETDGDGTLSICISHDGDGVETGTETLCFTLSAEQVGELKELLRHGDD